jgi:kelch-like protein 1/4/5
MENCLQNLQLTDIVLCIGMPIIIVSEQLKIKSLGERRIAAHRLVLSACSEYFSAMFSSGLKESYQAEVELHDVDPDALQELVQYCYTGSLELKEETVEIILATSCLLQISQVIRVMVTE